MELQKLLKLKFNRILLGMLFGIPTFLDGQSNLVVNPDIEIYDTCPDDGGQIGRAVGWWQYCIATTDYLNSCSLSPIMTIPSAWGYQLPETGSGYLHASIVSVHKPRDFMYFWNDSLGFQQSREPIAGTFLRELRPVPHKIEFYISKSSASNYFDLFTNAFDLMLMLDQDIVFQPVSPYINQENVIPIYTGDSVLQDTIHWMKLSACFLPKGGERYFAVGAFRDTSEIKFKFAEGENWGNNYVASYYFDSFKVYECDTCCIGAFQYDDAVTLVNNPSSNTNPAQFTVLLHGQTTATLTLYDSAGRLVKKIAFSDLYTQYTLDEILAQGMYHYAFESSNGTKDYGKLLVVE